MPAAPSAERRGWAELSLLFPRSAGTALSLGLGPVLGLGGPLLLPLTEQEGHPWVILSPSCSGLTPAPSRPKRARGSFRFQHSTGVKGHRASSRSRKCRLLLWCQPVPATDQFVGSSRESSRTATPSRAGEGGILSGGLLALRSHPVKHLPPLRSVQTLQPRFAR